MLILFFQDSSNKLDLSQISSDQLTNLISQSAGVESTQSNRSQETGSHLSSPLTGTKCNVHTLGFFKRKSIKNIHIATHKETIGILDYLQSYKCVILVFDRNFYQVHR